MLPAPHRGLEETKSSIRMLVKARVAEAVVVVSVPQVVDDVTFQTGVGPYALVALVSRTIRLPANECGRDTPLLEDLVHVREVWYEATNVCEKQGKVLCGVEQPCINRGCSYNRHYQWTGQECQAGDAGLPAACASA